MDRIQRRLPIWTTFAEHYPFFALHGMDWQAVRTKYRPRVTAATKPEELFAVLQNRDRKSPCDYRRQMSQAIWEGLTCVGRSRKPMGSVLMRSRPGRTRGKCVAPWRPAE